jgi:arginase family enzyme
MRRSRPASPASPPSCGCRSSHRRKGPTSLSTAFLERRGDQSFGRTPRTKGNPRPVEPDAPRSSCLGRRALLDRQGRRHRRSLRRARAHRGRRRRIVAAGAAPLGAGGDHLCTLPAFRAVAGSRPVGMIQFDAHSDTNDTYVGDNPYTNGTPIRRAVEEGLLATPKHAVQVGIRGSIYDPRRTRLRAAKAWGSWRSGARKRSWRRPARSSRRADLCHC